MNSLTNYLLVAMVMLTAATTISAQDDYSPFYITVTQSHWNWDNDGTNERWLELEKAWHDNVVAKNEHIVGSGVYYHHYTGDNSEVLFVTVYPSWEAIVEAGKRSGELAREAWPDEEARAKTGAERGAYYAPEHSDEIYVSTPYSKPLTTVPEEALVYLVVTRHLAFPDDGDNKEFASLLKEFHENVTHKNPHLLAYYMHRHAWGSDGRDMETVFVVKDMDAIDEMQAAQGDLIEAYWPDEEKRKAFFKKMNKYWTPWHSDRIYKNEPLLMKVTAPPPVMDAEK